MLVRITAEAATRAVARAKQTTSIDVSAASEAAVEVIEQAGVAVEATVVAAAAATKAAERMRQVFAGVINAEVDANEVLAQIAKTLSEELSTRRQIEARLLEQEAEVTAFAGMIAYELQAPLRAVCGFTTMLRSDLDEAVPGGLDAASLDKMDRLLAATERMRTLVEDQLAFVAARERSRPVEPVAGAMAEPEVLVRAEPPLNGRRQRGA
jgi:signal transduction histidine kinase